MISEFGVLGAAMSLIIALSISFFIFYVIVDKKIISIFLSSLFFSYILNKYEINSQETNK